MGPKIAKPFDLKNYFRCSATDNLDVGSYSLLSFQANGIKIGPQHSPANPNMPSGSQGGSGSGGCC